VTKIDERVLSEKAKLFCHNCSLFNFEVLTMFFSCKLPVRAAAADVAFSVEVFQQVQKSTTSVLNQVCPVKVIIWLASCNLQQRCESNGYLLQTFVSSLKISNLRKQHAQ